MGLYDYDVRQHVARVSEATLRTNAIVRVAAPEDSVKLVHALSDMAVRAEEVIGFVEPLVSPSLYSDCKEELAGIQQWCALAVDALDRVQVEEHTMLQASE